MNRVPVLCILLIRVLRTRVCVVPAFIPLLLYLGYSLKSSLGYLLLVDFT